MTHTSPQGIERLRAHVADLLERSPWYREKLAGIDPASIRSPEDIARLPFTTKQDLSEHHGRFLCVPRQAIAEHVFTSGTTGRPVPIALSAADVERLARNEQNALGTAGITAADTVQITTTLDKLFMAGLAYWLGLRAIGAATVRSGPGHPEGQWRTAMECGTTALIVVPSFLLRMLEEWERLGLAAHRTAITRAVCIGEPIANTFGEPNLLARRIMERYGIALHSTYASTEMATACTEAAPFAGHVVPAELMHIEVVDEEGRPVPEGQAGEVVATPFGIEAMPLLRFRTGDICSWRMGADTNGIPAKLLGPVLGRKEQRLKLKGTTLFPAHVTDTMNAMDAPPEFVMVCVKDEFGGDDLEILVDLEGPALAQLRDRLRAALRVVPRLTTLPRSAIDTLKWPPGSRKPVLFIDRRSEG
ncbi:MAG: AMP-binding protein [Flavobacteriales bacterium]|nr:AMP-binding protein [Flavobacteriales bacterium]